MTTIEVRKPRRKRVRLKLWQLVRRPDIAQINTVGKALIDALRENA